MKFMNGIPHAIKAGGCESQVHVSREPQQILENMTGIAHTWGRIWLNLPSLLDVVTWLHKTKPHYWYSFKLPLKNRFALLINFGSQTWVTPKPLVSPSQNDEVIVILSFILKRPSQNWDGETFWCNKLDNGWPESAEEQVTLVLYEVVHKRTVVNVLILIQFMNRKEMTTSLIDAQTLYKQTQTVIHTHKQAHTKTISHNRTLNIAILPQFLPLEHQWLTHRRCTNRHRQ